MGDHQFLLEGISLEDIHFDVIDDIWKGIRTINDVEEISFVANQIDSAILKQFLSNIRLLPRQEIWNFITSHRQLLIILYYFMSQKDTTDTSSQLLCFLSAQIYNTLLQIPGSITYNIFHPLLFRANLNLLKLWHKDVSSNGEAEKTKKGKKAKYSTHIDQIDDNKSLLLKWNVSLLQQLQETFKVLPLVGDTNQDLLAFVIETVAVLSRFNAPQKEKTSLRKRQPKFKANKHKEKACNLCYSILQTLLQLAANIEDARFTLQETLRNVMPNLLMQYPGEGPLNAGAVPEYKLATRRRAMVFLQTITCALNDNSLWSIFSKEEEEEREKGEKRGKHTKRSRSRSNARLLKVQHQLITESYGAIHALLQHLCAKVPSKPSYRLHLCSTLSSLLFDLPSTQRPRFLHFIQRFSRNSQATYRGFAVELAYSILSGDDRQELLQIEEEEEEEEEEEYNSSNLSGCSLLVDVVISRASDRVAAVRTKALNSVASLLDVALLEDSVLLTDMKQVVVLNENNNSDNNRINLFRLLRRRAVDDKCNVRRAAVKALTSLGLFIHPFCLSKADIDLLSQHCYDESVSIRKQAMSSLSSLLEQFPCNTILRSAWLHAVLPKVSDVEASVVDLSLSLVSSLIVDSITNGNETSNKIREKRVRKEEEEGDEEEEREGEEERNADSVWDLLAQVSEDADLVRYLERIFGLLEKRIDNTNVNSNNNDKRKRRKNKKAFVAALQTRGEERREREKGRGKVRGERARGEEEEEEKKRDAAWMLLAMIASLPSYSYLIQVEGVLQEWNMLKSYYDNNIEEKNSKRLEYVLDVVGRIGERVGAKEGTRLAEELLEQLRAFKHDPAVIGRMVRALQRVCEAKAPSKREANTMVDHWVSLLLSDCDTVVSGYVLPSLSSSLSPSSESMDIEGGKEREGDRKGGMTSVLEPKVLIRYFFTLGELAQLRPHLVPTRVITVVQALIAPTLPSSKAFKRTGDIVAAMDAQLSSSSEKGLWSSINSSKREEEREEDERKEEERVVPPSVRAYAFVTLGKLCLEDASLAKKCIAAFAKELETSNSSVVRNNVMVVMCDLCIRYTALVDGYLPQLAMCLRDPSELVRRQTLLLLTRLLQQDYVKWKGTLFYRFVVALVDSSPAVRRFANYCLVSLASSKNTHMFFSHFVDTLFHLHDCRLHPLYNQFPQSERERELFSMKGEIHTPHRHGIYKTLLTHMSPEQKFQTTAKLCQEVLGAVVDGLIPLNSSTAPVIRDTLTILSSKDIEVRVNGIGSNAALSMDEQEEHAAEAVAAAKGKILTKIVKKNVVENIVPIVIRLKQIMEEQHSPLLGILSDYITDMMKDYKDEIQDILVADKQLARELDYDMRIVSNNNNNDPRRRMRKRRSLASYLPSIDDDDGGKGGVDIKVHHSPCTPTHKNNTPNSLHFTSKTPLSSSKQKRRASLVSITKTTPGYLRSPRTTSPNPELEKFSVPRLRAGVSTPISSSGLKKGRRRSIINPSPLSLTSSSSSSSSSPFVVPNSRGKKRNTPSNNDNTKKERRKRRTSLIPTHLPLRMETSTYNPEDNKDNNDNMNNNNNNISEGKKKKYSNGSSKQADIILPSPYKSRPSAVTTKKWVVELSTESPVLSRRSQRRKHNQKDVIGKREPLIERSESSSETKKSRAPRRSKRLRNYTPAPPLDF